jgi:hypothetical protein
VDPRLTFEWPKQGKELWTIFQSLARQPGINGPGQISQQEIQAWQFNHGARLTPWELEMIAMFDRIEVDVMHKEKQ